MRPKIYLAGPDVFRPDAIAHGRALCALCEAAGFEGLFPLDGTPEVPAATPGAQAGTDNKVLDAARIYQANVALIRRSDAVLANLENFRGYEPDSGTAFEVGFAIALGIPVWTYGGPAVPIVDQVPGDAQGRDAQGWLIEDFSLPRNLMLACSVTGTARDAPMALKRVQDYFAKKTAGDGI